MGVPILGICYGQQVMMKMLGGEVISGSGTSEFGKSYVKQKNQKIKLLDGLFNKNKTEQVWMSHGDHVSLYQIILKYLVNLKMHHLL